MPRFSEASLEKLETCHPDLRRLFKTVILFFDCTIVCGHRGEKEQHEAFINHNSNVDWPDGNHNSVPSYAVDAMPYPIDWDDAERIAHFAGMVMGIAAMMGIKVRWGHDWDGDTDLRDQKFIDAPHYVLIK
jgi:peptidoglycan L-alanyl-D-glutamate endopeptidase CwlK